MLRKPCGPAGHACAGRVRPWSEAPLRLEGDVEDGAAQYGRGVFEESRSQSALTTQVRAIVPVFALVVAIVAGVTDPSSGADLILAAVPVGAFAAWAYVPKVPLWAVSVAVLVPVVIAQRSGQLEPLMFDVSLLGFVIGRWADSLAIAAGLGLLAALSPIAASLLQDPSEIAVGIWIMGIAFPWALGRLAARQSELATELDATRRELAQQALLEERRRIARDVHDLVGHGLAAVMLQITSARHVLHRDPAAAEEALRTAEDVGRRNMQELRHTVALLRRDDEAGVAPPLPVGSGISAHSSTMRRSEASPSNCTREGIFRGSHRASAWRSTGSSRRRSRMRPSTPRSRGPFSDSRLPMGERPSSPRPPGPRSPVRPASRSDPVTA